ncbi:MAG TPA: hypothetical protein VE422_40805 [Terriglobia bacterium]|nr:hypothetical protein [Terriglobia bacterium]
MLATALETDTIWLRQDYQVAPVNPRLAARLPELRQALKAGVIAYPDASRSSFYDIELPNGWAYIHVRDEKQTVYLVAYSRD